MGKSKELNFQPSRKLSFLTGLFEGIGEMVDEKKAEESAAAKQRDSLIPHLLRQMQFQQTEARESEEFRIKHQQTLDEFGFKKAEATRLRDFETWKIKTAQEFDQRMATAKFDREDARTEMDQWFQTRMAKLDQAFTAKESGLDRDLTVSEGKLGREVTTGEGALNRTSREKVAADTQTAIAERQADMNKFTEVQNKSRNDLERDLRGKAFAKEEQVVVDNYISAMEQYGADLELMTNPENQQNEVLFNRLVNSSDETARQVRALNVIREEKGLIPLAIPPSYQQYIDRWWPRGNQEFGAIPREEPTTLEPKAITPKDTPQRPSSDVDTAIVKLKKFGTTVAPGKIKALQDAGFSQEQIDTIKGAISIEGVKKKDKVEKPPSASASFLDLVPKKQGSKRVTKRYESSKISKSGELDKISIPVSDKIQVSEKEVVSDDFFRPLPSKRSRRPVKVVSSERDVITVPPAPAVHSNAIIQRALEDMRAIGIDRDFKRFGLSKFPKELRDEFLAAGYSERVISYLERELAK